MTTKHKAFAKQFEEEVYQAYRRMGSKLRWTVRNKNGVDDSTTFFEKVDGYKHLCMLGEGHVGDWVDHLDEIKVDTNERQVLANANAFALGRKTDDLIIEALGNSLHSTSGPQYHLTKTKVAEAFEILEHNNVPDDGNRFAIIGWKQWVELMDTEEFANADYVEAAELPWRGTQAKRWLGSIWMPHSGLPLDQVSGVRRCYWYHRGAVGHAIGDKVVSDITWHSDRGAHFVSSFMDQGACLIENDWAVEMACLEQPVADIDS